MMGMINAAFEQTVAYLQERTQFGKRIEAYQAPQTIEQQKCFVKLSYVKVS